MEKRADGAGGPVPVGMDNKRTSPWGNAYARFWNPETKMPCSSPPFGELVAVDVNSGSVAWRVPLGVFDELKARGYDKTGTPNIGGTIVTSSGVVFVGATIDKRFRAFNAQTGALLWETTLDASAHATPMTFMGRDHRQYVWWLPAAPVSWDRLQDAGSWRLRCQGFEESRSIELGLPGC